MIISHSRKFIFIKTLKTGGTSLEEALWRHCSGGDVLTPMIPPKERARARQVGIVPRNYGIPLRSYNKRQLAAYLLKRKTVARFAEHMPAWEVRDKVEPMIWNSYYKFCVVRHPFDRCVSRFYYTAEWERDLGRVEVWQRDDIGQFIRYHPQFMTENWHMFTVRDEVIVDKVVKYEDLSAELGEVSARIGLGHNIHDDMKALRSKAGIRPANTGYDRVLGDQDKALVSQLCAKEMAMFGYAA